MYKIMIAEDEMLVRHYLRTLIRWETYGFTICGEALNGTAAVQMIEASKPDVVLMDIHMPGMSGVELSRYIAERHKDIRMVAISSYDKFEYVRETLRNGAVDYLLKHSLDRSGLVAVLRKVRSQLDEARKLRQEKELQDKRWDIVGPSIVSEYVKGMMLGVDNDAALVNDCLRTLGLFQGKQAAVAVMQPVNFFLLTDSYDSRRKGLFVRSILDLCRQSISQSANGICAYVEEGTFGLLFAFEERSQQTINMRMNSQLERIQKALQTYLNVHCEFSFSQTCSKPADIPRCYRTALGQLESRMMNGGRPSGLHGALLEQTPITVSLQDEKNLLSHIQCLDTERAMAVLDDVFWTAEKQRLTISQLQLMLSELMTLAGKVWKKSGMSGSFCDGEGLPSELLGRDCALEEIKAWTQELFARLIDKLQPAQLEGRYSKYVDKAIQVARERYRDNISLELVAEAIGITPSYLSRLFKEETKMNFTEYMNHLRIDVSKQLIDHGDYRIKDIYDKIGFTSYNYFFKVFKDIVGVTPQTYAKKGSQASSDGSPYSRVHDF